MATRSVQETSLTAIADAIRAKTGLTGELVFPDGFKNAIAGIQAGGAKMATGYIIPSEDVTSDVDIVHNLGEIPKYAIVYREQTVDGGTNDRNTMVNGEVILSYAINNEIKSKSYYNGQDGYFSPSNGTGASQFAMDIEASSELYTSGSCVHSCTNTTAKLYPIKNGTKKFAAGNKYRWILICEK